MAIDLKTVKHISKLARISVNDEKAKKLEKDLNSIFKWIEQLNKLNTDITPNEGITASSLSVPNSGTAIRSASIIFKKNFLDFAAKSLNLNINNINLEDGVAKDPNSNASISFWDFSFMFFN